MSGDKKGMETEGVPKGPEIPAKSQVPPGQRHSLPGLEEELPVEPVTTKLPTVTEGTHEDDMLRLREYRGVDKLHNKKAIITGGDSGIGRAIAVMFAREGADVAIVYLPKEERDARESKAMVEAEGRQCIMLPFDVSSEDNCKRIVDETVKALGRVDILVNNAAHQARGYIQDVTMDSLHEHFSTNIFAMFMLAKHAVPHMTRGSSIINSTSVVAYRGSASLLEYGSTKGAIVAFTRCLALGLAEKGIRVNAVAPGPVWSPLNPASRDEQNLKKWLDREPLVGHIGQPSEIAPSFVFLASGESSQFTGQTLHPNGGDIINT